MQHLYISVTKKRWLQLECISFILKISFTSTKDIWGLLMSRGSIVLHFYIAWQSDEKFGDVMNDFLFEWTERKLMKIFVTTKAVTYSKSLSGVVTTISKRTICWCIFASKTLALLKNSLNFGFIIRNVFHEFNELFDVK